MSRHLVDPADCNCWTASAAGVWAGILTDGDGALAPVVLGEEGRSRRKLVLGTRDVAPGDRIPGALGMAGFDLAGQRFVRWQTDDPEFVRVRTDARYRKGTTSDLQVFGAAKILAKGLTAWGDAGRLGVHPDALLALRKGSAVFVQFTGDRIDGGGGGSRWIVRTGTENPRMIDFGYVHEGKREIGPAPALDALNCDPDDLQTLLEILTEAGASERLTRNVSWAISRLTGPVQRA